MSRKKQDKISIGDKILYNVKATNGWSIIIMPDNILIDNYHINTAHIHPDPNNHSHKIELIQQDADKIFEMIKDYLNESDVFDVEELVRMLK